MLSSLYQALRIKKILVEPTAVLDGVTLLFPHSAYIFKDTYNQGLLNWVDPDTTFEIISNNIAQNLKQVKYGGS